MSHDCGVFAERPFSLEQVMVDGHYARWKQPFILIFFLYTVCNYVFNNKLYVCKILNKWKYRLPASAAEEHSNWVLNHGDQAGLLFITLQRYHDLFCNVRSLSCVYRRFLCSFTYFHACWPVFSKHLFLILEFGVEGLTAIDQGLFNTCCQRVRYTPRWSAIDLCGLKWL